MFKGYSTIKYEFADNDTRAFTMSTECIIGIPHQLLFGEKHGTDDSNASDPPFISSIKCSLDESEGVSFITEGR
jgi:hypothetical protein